MSFFTFRRMAISQGLILWRNVTFWLISIFIAVLSMLVFGLLFKPGVQAFDLAIVDQDHTAEAAQLSQAFTGLNNVNVVTGSQSEELAALADGNRGAVIIIPQGYASELQSAHASLQVYYDNTNLVRIGYVTSTVDSVIQAYNERIAGQAQPIALNKQGVETKNVRFIDFLTPGMVGMTIMFTNLAVGFMLVNWREQGILRRLGVTPLRPGLLIASQAASFSLVSLAQVTVLLTIARLVFGVTIEGSYLLLAVTGMLGVLCMLSLGYTIASFARSVTAYSAVQQLLAFPMLFLGRSYFPIDPSPALNPIVQAVPLTHLNDALREIINRGGGVGDVWTSWLVLLAWAVAGYLISIRLFRWQ
jgi:ABC-type multidrug transport system, permease component